ncbi:DNA primase family protein [Avibacterium sp. 20-129]|uniref:DNA primase family protein n=1 Tax=Avibacterium sp. 20-129 TaxID=2911525 RepID=UPI0022477EFB|nr:DUF5906 domain-containing protein [Avibacterium sp. 20-129]MCW9698154.1 hypothetical protein [Avibacterium sp. 20-129]
MKSNKNHQDEQKLFKGLKDYDRYLKFCEWNKKIIMRDKLYQTNYFYNGRYWEILSEDDLDFIAMEFFKSFHYSFNISEVERLRKTIEKHLEKIGKPNLDFIAFNNGIINRKTGDFLPHNKDYFLRAAIDLDYSLEKHSTPNFNKWLDWTSQNNPVRRKTLLAALYMILSNCYQWQLFLEVTGVGGSGKSVFNKIALFLVGEHNAASVYLKDLEKPSARTKLLDKIFIYAPDQGKIATDGAVIKGLTGEDKLGFEPKYKEGFDDYIRAVFLITGNEPIIFTEHNGGISRRRVLFHFADKVPENMKDDNLTDKIKQEIPNIITLLIDTFKHNPQEAKELLIAQRDSKEALQIKMENDHLVHFASFFEMRNKKGGLRPGISLSNKNPFLALYSTYLEYCRMMGIDRPIKRRGFMNIFLEALRTNGNKETFLEGILDGNQTTNIYLKFPIDELKRQWEN